MPLRLRAQRRAFSRDAARHYVDIRPAKISPPVDEQTGMKKPISRNRAERRSHGQRGDISALIHGKHDTAWLYSGTLNASGQARINHKRQQRAEYWQTFTRLGELGAALNARLRGVMSVNDYRAECGLPPLVN